MKFFVLKIKPQSSETSGETVFSAISPINMGKAPQCVRCGSFVGALVWHPPFNVELELWQAVFGDIAFGPTSSDLLITERFKNIVQEFNLTGLTGFERVEVKRIRRHKRFKDSPPCYYHVVVVRSNATIDDSASEIYRLDTPDCPECRSATIRRAKKIIIKPDTWKGEDIFIARGLPGRIITSERFKMVCSEFKIANAVFIQAEQFSFDNYPWETGYH